MSKIRLVLASAVLVSAISAVSMALPAQTRTQPANAAVVTKCPEPTAEGEYFERGIDKDGNVICGFQYNQECPYASGYSATDPICQKLGDQQKPAKQTAPVKQAPVQKPTNQCEGK